MQWLSRIKLLFVYLPCNFKLSPAIRQPDTIHNMLLEELRRYLFIGGMPECVNTFVQTGKIRDAFEVQADLVTTFRQDFSKYAPYSDARCLNSVLTATAKHVGRQIKYSELAEGFTNPTFKKTFDLLSLAQVIRKVPATFPAGLPLGAAASERKFKALMLDVGLMQHFIMPFTSVVWISRVIAYSLQDISKNKSR